MTYENRRDFRKDYPGGYVKGGKVFDYKGNVIGYITTDKVIRINDGTKLNGALYHYIEEKNNSPY